MGQTTTKCIEKLHLLAGTHMFLANDLDVIKKNGDIAAENLNKASIVWQTHFERCKKFYKTPEEAKNDSKLKDSVKLLEKMKRQLTSNKKDVLEKAKQIAANLELLRSNNEVFRAYIAKKKNGINILKSKKSVPMAEETINQIANFYAEAKKIPHEIISLMTPSENDAAFVSLTQISDEDKEIFFKPW